ncbi:hypothetical protein V5O48_007603 [Marasmius crinis-equi]|uniref:Uncharacterized protein n=1 Tax=Marasmius crinis-equi TaxID=585013 RepID=A0ABR3FGC3_9AGAR
MHDSNREILDIEDWESYKGLELDVDDEEISGEADCDPKDEFERAIAGDLEFDGDFAHSVVYPDAPNPGLKLDGLGPIGLPLNTIQVEMIMKDPNTEYKPEERVWKFSGSRIQSTNPRWHDWLKTEVIEALHAKLDASIQLSACQRRLKYLSISAPHTDKRATFAKRDADTRQYAELVVVLPSCHSGGSIECAYEGKSKTFPIASDNELSTVIIGAYTDVAQYLGPIESGYVVCLHFELACLEGFQIPRLPKLDDARKRLRLALQSWRAALSESYGRDLGEFDGIDEDCQIFLLLMLKYEYSTSNFKAGDLRGCDRLLLTQLAPLAKAYGFDLHLGELASTMEGTTTFNKRRKKKSYYCDCESESSDGSDEETDPETLEMDDDDYKDHSSGGLYMSGIFALDGMPKKASGIEIYESKDRERYCVNGDIFDRERTTQLQKEDRSTGYLTWEWKRQVIIVSPSDADLGFKPGDTREFACQLLTTSSSTRPVKKEGWLADSLVEWVPTQANRVYGDARMQEMQRVTGCVRQSAERWGDHVLFRRLLQACGLSQAISFIGVDGLASGSRAFKWVEVEDLYTQVILETRTNEQRWQLAERIRILAMDAKDQVIVAWCKVQSNVILDTLREVPLQEVDWIFDFLQSHEDPTETLRVKFLPKLHTTQPADVKLWEALLSRLYEISQNGDPSLFDKSSLPSIVTESLLQIASSIQPLPTDYTGSCWMGPLDSHYEAAINKVLPFVHLSAKCQASHATTTLFQRMWDLRVEHVKKYHVISIAHYYALLVPEMDSLAREYPEYRTSLKVFFEHALELLSPRNVTQDYLTALRNLDDPLGIFQERLNFDALIKFPVDTIVSLGKWIADTYREEATKCPAFSSKYQDVLKLCLNALGSHPSFSLASWGVMGSKQALLLIRFCFSTRSHSEVISILCGYLVHHQSRSVSFIRELLVPLLSALPGYLRNSNSSHGTGLSITTRPFSDFVGEVVRRFTRHVLGPKPQGPGSPEELRSIGCGCRDCDKHLEPFLKGTNQWIRITGNEKTRTHLAQRLAPTQAWGVTWSMVQSKKKQGMQLQVDKPYNLVVLGRWAATQVECRKLLWKLGDEQQQQQILGTDYEWVVGTIEGKSVPPSLAQVYNTLKRPAEDGYHDSSKRRRVGLVCVILKTGMPLASLPTEIYASIISHFSPDDVSNDTLSLTRALPYSPIPQGALFRSVRIRDSKQLAPFYNRLRRSPEDEHASDLVRTFSLEAWNADAEVLLDVVHLLPNLKTLALWIGPLNFTPQHLEELFDVSTKRNGARHLGSYFDTTLYALSQWPRTKLPTLAIVQDPFEEEDPKSGRIIRRNELGFAQPIVFFQIDPALPILIRSPSMRSSLTSLRFRLPTRNVTRSFTHPPPPNPPSFGFSRGDSDSEEEAERIRLKYTHQTANLSAAPYIRLLDLSTSSIPPSAIPNILAKYPALEHLILDKCTLLPGELAVRNDGNDWAALAKSFALSGSVKAQERQKKVEQWLERLREHESGQKGNAESSTTARAQAKKARRGRKGVATATISLRKEDTAPAPPPIDLKKGRLGMPRGPGGTTPVPISLSKRVRILPSLPTLRTFSTDFAPPPLHPASHHAKARNELIQTIQRKWEEGWAEGITQLVHRRELMRTSWRNGNVRIVRFAEVDELKLGKGPDDDEAFGDTEEGFDGLVDMQQAEDFDVDLSGQSVCGKAPVLCLAGKVTSEESSHAEGCGHGFARDVWPWMD